MTPPPEPTPPASLNIEALARQGYILHLENETAEERTARLTEWQKQNDHRRLRELLGILCVISLVIAGIVVSVWVMFSENAHISGEMRSKAETLLASLVAGALSFLGGLAVGRRSAED